VGAIMKKTIDQGEGCKVVKTLELNRETVATLRTRTSLRTGLVNAKPTLAVGKGMCTSSPDEM
jgi:hypothetical protein